MSERVVDVCSLQVSPHARPLALALALISGGGLACDERARPDRRADAESDITSSREHQPQRHEIDLFAFGRQLGTIAPCGCTSEPLGGLAYALGYIESESELGQRLILEPGSFLFPDPDGPDAPADEAAWDQAHHRAELLHARFSSLDALVSGLGPTDFASEKSGAALAELPLPRVIANLADDARPPGVESHRVVALGRGLFAAVTQVVDPELAEAAQARAWGKDFPALGEPLAALERLAPALASAQLQIVMVHGPRALAESVARELEGVDIVIIGGQFTNAEHGRIGSSAVQIGTVWVLEPGERAQTISHLTLSIAPSLAHGELPPEWTLIPTKEAREAGLARVEEKLTRFSDDPSADAAFIRQLERERERLRAELDSPTIPDEVKVAVIPEQTRVSCSLPEDAAARRDLMNYDAAAAARNRERFADVRAPAPAPGQPGYVGVDVCEDCHDPAVEEWETTVHARAHESLKKANKQFDLSCVACHVTAFREPGGSEVVKNQRLRAVQCEQCHGPGGHHAFGPTADNIRREAPESVCLPCHTPEHSDTFDYTPYLRDVLGPDHGATALAELGGGPTAHELRAAALKRAGGGCDRDSPTK